jgi:hypothetical protein
MLVRLASSSFFRDGMKHGESQRLSGRFNFDKQYFGSYENHGVYLIQYNEDLEPVFLDVEDRQLENEDQ